MIAAPSDAAAPGAATLQRDATRSLFADISLELTTNGKEAIQGGALHLEPGTKVYVPKVLRESLDDKLRQIRMLNEAGVAPVPHIVARHLTSRSELAEFLGVAVAEGGVSRVLVIGGDLERPAGPFPDAASVIASGILDEVGIEMVDVGGYPDGHPGIPDEVLLRDLRAKADLAAEHSLDLGIVTQFSFSADAIAGYCSMLAREGISVPVFAGLAGPTSPAQLLRFAKICGVRVSIRAANKLGMNALKLAANTTPDRHLEVLARHHGRHATGNLAGIHIFSFGGFVKSARWLGSKVIA